MLAPATLLEAALHYAELGWPVVPLHTPVAGVCDCPDTYKKNVLVRHGGAACDKPGKHPRTQRGLDDASTDRATIERWWKMWPAANIGIHLVRAGLVDIAPDSIVWQAQFVAHSLPWTPSFKSGGGDGHEHHLYVRPEDCPAYRLCRPDEYDVLSNGYAVMPPSLHASGERYAWMTDPDSLSLAPAPQWSVEMLTEAARRSRSTNGVAHLELSAVDEAPVQLHGEALERWNGQLVSLKPGGTVDRSLSLFYIGKDLAAAGASRSAISRCLQERDETLGWSKYVGRRDASSRYAIIADKAISGRSPRLVVPRVIPAAVDAAAGITWSEPEDRGDAVLSEQGDVEYVEDLLRPGRIITWAAEEGVGKSYAVDDELGIRMAVAGGAFAGIWPVVRKGRVLILSEMHSDDDYAREELTLASLGLTRSSLKGQYFRLSLMTAANGTPVLMAPAWRGWVIQWCRNHEIKLLVFDTATGAIQGDPWGDQIREVFRNLRIMLEIYPELAIILIVHLKKPTTNIGRRISDVMGEWGRWCDVIVMQERDGARTKISTMKRVRAERRIIATRQDGLLVEPKDIGDGSGPKVPLDKVIEMVQANHGITVVDLATRLGVVKMTAARYVRAAEANGQIRQEKGLSKGTIRLFPTKSTATPQQSATRDGVAVAVAVEDHRNEPTATPQHYIYSVAVGDAVVTARGNEAAECELCGASVEPGLTLCYGCEDEAGAPR